MFSVFRKWRERKEARKREKIERERKLQQQQIMAEGLETGYIFPPSEKVK